MLEKVETVLTVLMGFVFSIVICSVTFGLLYLSTGLIEARFDEADRIEDAKRMKIKSESCREYGKLNGIETTMLANTTCLKMVDGKWSRSRM